MTHDLIPVTFLLLFGFIVKVISDNRVRRLLIEKGQVDPGLKEVMDLKSKSGESSLKWGIVSLAVGVALILTHDMSEPIVFASLFIAAGVALIVFYFINKAKVES